jgi:hypothetical protein
LCGHHDQVHVERVRVVENRFWRAAGRNEVGGLQTVSA